MSLSLKPLMSYHADLTAPAMVGAGHFGNRVIFIVTGGTFEGERLRGKIQPGGGDWLLVGPDGFGRLDVRATFETDDGALIYGTYVGVIEFGERALAAMQGGTPTAYGEICFMTQLRFETGDQRYAWLNSTLAVAEGRVVNSAVEYSVFELVNSTG